MQDIKKEIPLVLIFEIKLKDPFYNNNGDDIDLSRKLYEDYSYNVRIETIMTYINSSSCYSSFRKVPFPNECRNPLIKYTLRQIIFRIGNIEHYHYMAASFVSGIINAINKNTFDGLPWCFIDDIEDIIPEDGNITICATQPIGGCWYWNDEYSLMNHPLYTNIKQPDNPMSLYWISVNTTDSEPYIELFYDNKINYYGVRLSKPICERYEGETKSVVIYEYREKDGRINYCTVGKIIDIVEDYAIIQFTSFPDKDYALFYSFIKNITECILYKRYRVVGTDTMTEAVIKVVTNKNKIIYYGKDDIEMTKKPEKDSRIEEVYNTLSSITKDLSGIYNKLQEVLSQYYAILNDNNLLPNSKNNTEETTKTDTKLILIVTDKNLIDATMDLKTAKMLDKYKLNIFGWMHDNGNISRIFVNSDTIYDTKLNSMKFEAIVFIWDENEAVRDVLYDRAFELNGNGVYTTSGYDSERYEFKYYYGNQSYTDKTYKVTKKG